MAGLTGRSKILCSRLLQPIRALHTSGRLFDEHRCVAIREAESFIERCMRSVGTPDLHCRALSQVLVAGDVRGHFSHGLNRLGKLCALVTGMDNRWRLIK